MEHLLQNPGVDLHRGAQQKILDRGVEIFAHHKARLGCEHDDIGRREILGEIADAPRHRRLILKLGDADSCCPRHHRDSHCKNVGRSNGIWESCSNTEHARMSQCLRRLVLWFTASLFHMLHQLKGSCLATLALLAPSVFPGNVYAGENAIHMTKVTSLRPSPPKGQVINANPAPHGQWPATFIFKNSVGEDCTATAVGPRAVLTAAHCLAAEANGQIENDKL